MITTAVFDTKPYDREPLQRASASQRHRVALPGFPADPGNRAPGERRAGRLRLRQ